MAQRSESKICILSIAVWGGAFCLWSFKLAKNETWRRIDWEPMAQSVVEWRIVARGLCTWRWKFFVMDREKCLWECITKMCTLKKIVSDEQQKKEECSQSQGSTCKNRACKIFAPKWQQKIACSVIALLAMFRCLMKKKHKTLCRSGSGWARKERGLHEAHCHGGDFRAAFLATCHVQNAVGWMGKFAVCTDFCSRILCVLPWRMITREVSRFEHYGFG